MNVLDLIMVEDPTISGTSIFCLHSSKSEAL